MSDYNWHCSGCGLLVFYNDRAYYSEELEDKVCYECHQSLGDSDVPDGTYQVESDWIRDNAR